jgi:hypothetical protein
MDGNNFAGHDNIIGKIKGKRLGAMAAALFPSIKGCTLLI